MNKIRLGIIGTGGISNSHVKAYKQMDDVEIVAGADIIPGKAREALDRWELPDAKAFENTQEMLDTMELDAVSVCTYNTAHAECAIQAMRAGCHVLLEKPMTVTLEDAQEIRRVEKETGKILTIGFQPRYDGRMKKIKEIVQSGKLGKIYYIQTGGGRRRGIPGSTFIEKRYAGVGALADIGCYSLDMVLNAIGYPKPLTVSAVSYDYFGKNPKYTPPEDAARFSVDDFCGAFIRLEGGITLDFRMSWAMHMDTHRQHHLPGHRRRLEGGARQPREPVGRRLGRQLRQRHPVPRRVRRGHLHTRAPARRQGGPLLPEVPLLHRRGGAGPARPHPHQPDHLQPGHHRRHHPLLRVRPRGGDPRRRDLTRAIYSKKAHLHKVGFFLFGVGGKLTILGLPPCSVSRICGAHLRLARRRVPPRGGPWPDWP